MTEVKHAYVLRKSASGFGGSRCDRCGKPFVGFVFKGVNSSRWQRRCRECAARMVSDGRATYAPGR